MGYVTKNHVSPDKWVIGGELAIEGSGQITRDGVPIDLGGSGASGPGAWTDITGKPAVIAAGADQAAARSAIGAGTSNLALGSTASTAAAGNHIHTATNISATAIAPGTATNVQGILAELAARIAALEAG